MKSLIVCIPSLRIDLNLESISTVTTMGDADAPRDLPSIEIRVAGSTDVLVVKGPEATAFLALWRDHTRGTRIDNLLERHADTLARAKHNVDIATARARAEAESRAADEKRRAGEAAARPGVGQIGFNPASAGAGRTH